MYRPGSVWDSTTGFRLARLLVALVLFGTFTVSCGDTEPATLGSRAAAAATSTSMATASTSTATRSRTQSTTSTTPTTEPTTTVVAAPIPDTPDLAVRDSGICAGSTVDTDEAIEPPVSASEMTRTGCALTNVLNAYFGAWAGHDVTAITSYFNNGVVIVVEGEAPFVAPGTYEAVAAVEILETFFNNGLCIKRPHRGGGSGRTHNETLFLTFDTGDTFQTQHRLRFTTDPFAAARDDEQPLVTHTISF